MRFKKATNSSKDIPQLSGVQFPKSDGLSVCFWFAMATIPRKMSAFFTYQSLFVDSGNNTNDLMIYIDNQTNFWLTFKGKPYKLYNTSLSPGRWTHVCWVWHHSHSWTFYLNGKNVSNSCNKDGLLKPFPKSKGDIILGQHLDQHLDHDNIAHSRHMFLGEMTEFFIYSRDIRNSEVMAAFQNHAGTINATVAWWQFQNSTKGENIIIKGYPFIHHFFITKFLQG